jgi:DALR anticodon binding domain/Arginyl tRNA synthetase N terminal domain
MNTVNNWKLQELTLKSLLIDRLQSAIVIVIQPVSDGQDAHPTTIFNSCRTVILPVQKHSDGQDAHPTTIFNSCRTVILPVQKHSDGEDAYPQIIFNSCGTGILPVRKQLKLTSNTCRHEIPLNRTKHETRVVYVSAIALKLANIWQQPPQTIATQLVENLKPLCNRDFAVETAPSGMIQFELTDIGLADWLQRLTQTALPLPESGRLSAVVAADRLFPIQYSHARCCSLLRMANRDRIMEIVKCDRTITSQIWSPIAPNPIPWLDENGRSRLVHPAEHNLISQLLAVLDSLAFVIEQYNNQKPVNYLKLANNLSEAFQTFYSQCRIWGEVKIETPKLAQARLGLVLVTQSLLRFMLEELLNAVAPLEL